LLKEGGETPNWREASARLPVSATLMNPITPAKFRAIPVRRREVDSHTWFCSDIRVIFIV
jgi:hypothetical protein